MSVICKDEDMPSYHTVLNWMGKYPEFLDRTARAKRDGTHALADQCIAISDDTAIDPAHKRIMVDTRIRLIGKWNRVDYGDRIVQEVTGKDGGPIELADARTTLSERIDALESKKARTE